MDFDLNKIVYWLQNKIKKVDSLDIVHCVRLVVSSWFEYVVSHSVVVVVRPLDKVLVSYRSVKEKETIQFTQSWFHPTGIQEKSKITFSFSLWSCSICLVSSFYLKGKRSGIKRKHTRANPRSCPEEETIALFCFFVFFFYLISFLLLLLFLIIMISCRGTTDANNGHWDTMHRSLVDGRSLDGAGYRSIQCQKRRVGSGFTLVGTVSRSLKKPRCVYPIYPVNEFSTIILASTDIWYRQTHLSFSLIRFLTSELRLVLHSLLDSWNSCCNSFVTVGRR